MIGSTVVCMQSKPAPIWAYLVGAILAIIIGLWIHFKA
jgi:hypothetical protein